MTLRWRVVSDLQAVVVVVDQEVLLEPQLLLSSCTAHQLHPRRGFLVCLVYMVQKLQGAVEGHFHLEEGMKIIHLSNENPL